MADTLEIVTADEVATYTGKATVPDLFVDLANELVTEAWKKPTDQPYPPWVRLIAMEVAARGARNPAGLQSWTRSVDDASRTERAADSGRSGIYLTDDEKRRLAGRPRGVRAGTIQTGVGHLPALPSRGASS